MALREGRCPAGGLRLQALRLHALVDAPMAYGSTFAREESYPEAVWHERAATGAAGGNVVTFVAERGNQLVGMATGLVVGLEPENNSPPTMVGVFVDGSVRRQGIADKVLESSWSSKSLVGRGAWVDSPRCVDHLRQRPCNSGLSSMPFPVHRHNQTERPYASGPEMGDSAGVSEPHSRCVKRTDARGVPHAPTYERGRRWG